MKKNPFIYSVVARDNKSAHLIIFIVYYFIVFYLR